MSNVTVIGLGPMGTAIAQTLIQNGKSVTVWNRSSEKAKKLIQQGAILASSVASAVSASPVVIICVSNYDTTYKILDTDEVFSTLADRGIVQMSTGTPQEARDNEAWAHERGAKYLDGAILATPSQMGKADTPIFVSGAKDAFQQNEEVLKILAGNVSFMGEQVGAAAAWDLAVLSNMFGSMTGFFHGARIFESEGIPVDSLGSMIANISPILGQMVKYESEVIQKEDYKNPQSAIDMCMKTIKLFMEQAHEAGINNEFPTFAMGIFQKALDMGYGNEELGALIKVLR
ncbi:MULTISPECIES: NAD(P)-dependent oxidoreductase [Bacillus]|uniref:3-hydroxyisobutyrate dehydrogenase n=2 Tax=Bacillus TaxID=1386 RepID=A0A0M5JMJ3_9BACI|nr:MULTISPECIES: NAD(P)-binding domain-containing protein [Bacillus]ALC83901.1 3-hydroxyisobutyrate dehydrogenase [Bacillus gobiensis]MBP1083040.1 3-hydroxyisobutyrate dehydrogenase-like beta-hydroxyacid dehydrogenase [Bacillus capparidis]MED1097991.1 NAD(P)-binding domain-containing protein [Bacillus capparidis]